MEEQLQRLFQTRWKLPHKWGPIAWMPWWKRWLLVVGIRVPHEIRAGTRGLRERNKMPIDFSPDVSAKERQEFLGTLLDDNNQASQLRISLAVYIMELIADGEDEIAIRLSRLLRGASQG